MTTTVIQHVLARLADLGIADVFGVLAERVEKRQRPSISSESMKVARPSARLALCLADALNSMRKNE